MILADQPVEHEAERYPDVRFDFKLGMVANRARVGAIRYRTPTISATLFLRTSGGFHPFIWLLHSNVVFPYALKTYGGVGCARNPFLCAVGRNLLRSSPAWAR